MIYHEISEAYMKDSRFEFGPEGQFNIIEGNPENYSYN